MPPIKILGHLQAVWWNHEPLNKAKTHKGKLQLRFLADHLSLKLAGDLSYHFGQILNTTKI